jgi:hypothetical protein
MVFFLRFVVLPFVPQNSRCGAFSVIVSASQPQNRINPGISLSLGFLEILFEPDRW